MGVVLGSWKAGLGVILGLFGDEMGAFWVLGPGKLVWGDIGLVCGDKWANWGGLGS